MEEDEKQFLTSNCNRLQNGKCCNLGCLRRGGYKNGDLVDYEKATCVPYEIYQKLSKEE